MNESHPRLHQKAMYSTIVIIELLHYNRMHTRCLTYLCL
jgi:hypothetical protein